MNNLNDFFKDYLAFYDELAKNKVNEPLLRRLARIAGWRVSPSESTLKNLEKWRLSISPEALILKLKQEE